MKRVNAEETYFDSMNDMVIVLCCKEDIAEEGPKHIVLEPVWKKYEPDDSPVEYLTLADISEQFQGRCCLMVIAETPLSGRIYIAMITMVKRNGWKSGQPVVTHRVGEVRE